MKELSSILTKIVSFTNKHSINAEFHIHTVNDLRGDTAEQNENWKKFEKNAGVYCFFDTSADTCRYIGMSHNDTGNRLHGWLFKGNKINEDLQSEDLILHIVLKEHPYMASSLENYLIREVKTIHNVTGVIK